MPNPIMLMIYKDMKDWENTLGPSDKEGNKLYEKNMFRLYIIKFRCRNYLKKGMDENEYEEMKKKTMISFIKYRFKDTYDREHITTIDYIFERVKDEYKYGYDTD